MFRRQVCVNVEGHGSAVFWHQSSIDSSRACSPRRRPASAAAHEAADARRL